MTIVVERPLEIGKCLITKNWCHSHLHFILSITNLHRDDLYGSLFISSLSFYDFHWTTASFGKCKLRCKLKSERSTSFLFLSLFSYSRNSRTLNILWWYSLKNPNTSSSKRHHREARQLLLHIPHLIHKNFYWKIFLKNSS